LRELTQPQLGQSFLAGATLSSLLLFPLVNALTSGPDWLHWTRQDGLETLFAWALMALGVAVLLHVAASLVSSRAFELIHGGLLFVGLFFAAGALIRVEVIGGYVAQHRRASVVIGCVMAAGLLGASLWRVLSPMTSKRYLFRHCWPVLSPVSLVFLFHLAMATGVARDVSAAADLGTPGTSAYQKTTPLTVVLLFDELSADLLYGSRATDLGPYPALAELVRESMIFRNAYLPGGATATAIPALFHGGGENEGLSGLIAAGHLDVRVFGWYHDYCRELAKGATICKSVSVYNSRTLRPSFSPAHPLWTNLNLLPFEWPFGWLKIPAATSMHRETWIQAMHWTDIQVQDPRSDIIYTHFNVPHLPLLSEELSATDRRRFVMDEHNYIGQFRYVDEAIRLVKRRLEVVARHRPVNLVVLSDHNARPLTPKDEHTHVVMMVNAPKHMFSPYAQTQRVHAGDLVGVIASGR